MLTVALVIAGLVALPVVMRIMLARSSTRLRQEFQQQIDAFTARVEAAGAAPAQRSPAPSTEITQTDNAIAAAAAALGARKVHVRPAKPQPTHPVGDPWAQQGRAGVWSSHDIAQRWH
jgi:hypothetical protein